MNDSKPKAQPSVTVFGAGVAGLTVAHELVERGFSVKVVEKTQSLDIDGDCEVGGLARSQYSHAPLPEEANWRDFETGHSMHAAETVLRVPQHIYFETPAGGTNSVYNPDYALRYREPVPDPKDTNEGAEAAPVVDAYAVRNGQKLKEVAEALWNGAKLHADIEAHREALDKIDVGDVAASLERILGQLEPLEVEVRGHCNADHGPVAARDAGIRWAESVEKELVEQLKARCIRDRLRVEIIDKIIELQIVPMGSYSPIADESSEFGRRLNCRVDFRIREVRLPGEHGYRFFPRFYRHLDDVMKRTPIYDAHGVETGRTVYDNLEALQQTALAFADAQPQVAVLRRRPASIEEARARFGEIRSALQATPEDLVRSMAKFMRYMTSCSERRKLECEDISWWDFLEGPKYSTPMQRYLRATPQAMVAMSVTTSDARTNGNATVQLLLDQLTDGSQVDRTLNGPTSEAWLRHWKTYLRRQGVVFYLGELEKIAAQDVPVFDAEGQLQRDLDGKLKTERRLVPLVKEIRKLGNPPIVSKAETPPPADRDRHPDAAEFGNEDYYVLALPPTAAKGMLKDVADEDLNHTFRTLKHYDFTGALGSMVGIQFYFRNNFKFFPGHTFFVDSAWRLTSISQLQFWREKRNLDSGYLGILSVDIGNMYKRDTSQARMLAFESQWHAEQAQWHAEQAHYLDNEEEKKRAQLAADAAKAAVAMRHLLPVETTTAQGDALRKIWKLPWLRPLLELVDAAPELLTEEEIDIIAKRVAREPRPTDEKLHIIAVLDAFLPQLTEEEVDIVAELVARQPQPTEAELRNAEQLTGEERDIIAQLQARPTAKQPTDEELDAIAKLAARQPQPIGDALAAGAAAIREVPLEKRKLRLPRWKEPVAMPDRHFHHLPASTDLAQMLEAEGDTALDQVVHAGALAIAAATLAPGGKTAWKSTRQEIARTTWRQIKLGLDYDVARTLPDPIFYWIDDTLEFENDRPKENHSQLLCELTGKFEGRPGPLPNTPGTLDSVYYEVCRKQWVLTGMITKTYTRITTMELCCESGRHAANAVLHDVEHPEFTRTGDWIGTRIGDYCEIWDPEQCELDDLAPLKRVDARLCAEGLPHFMDILGIEPLMEQYLSGAASGLPYDRMLAFWKAARGVGENDWGTTGLAAPLWDQQRELLSRVYGPSAGPMLGKLFEQGLRHILNRGAGVDPVDPVDPVEWFFRLFYPRHDESNPEALRKLFRDWADFVEKSLLKGGQS